MLTRNETKALEEPIPTSGTADQFMEVIEDTGKSRWLTPTPWVDYTRPMNAALKEYRKETGAGWHGTPKRDNEFLILVANNRHHGEDVNPEWFPGCIDCWDLNKVIMMRWSDLPRKCTSISTDLYGDHFNWRHIIACVNGAPSLIEEIRRLRQEVARLTTPAPSATCPGTPCRG